MKNRKTATETQKVQEDSLKKIGSKIRAERKRLGLSLEALAKKAGISKMTLQRIETSVTSPSIVVLSQISSHLNRPLESFIREGKADVFLLKRNQQDALFNHERGFRIIGPKGLIADRITLTYSEIEKDAITEPHTNNGFEWAYLVEGSAVLEVDGEKYLLETGDAVYYDAHFSHSMRVIDKIKYVGLFLKDDQGEG
jgi:transcriptional regulator with XRE-family HTH domain